VHHNLGDGIWYDGAPNGGVLIEGNRVEDNGRTGITIELVNGAVVRHNTLKRNAEDAILASMSQDAEIHNNAIEGRAGIQYFLNCYASESWAGLANLSSHDNAITLDAQPSAYAAGLAGVGGCDLSQHVNGSKNLTFTRNVYAVPSSGSYWLWGGWKSFAEWQALGHDAEIAPVPGPLPEPEPEPTPTPSGCLTFRVSYQPGARLSWTMKNGEADPFIAARSAELWVLISRSKVRSQTTITMECRAA
jgi:hypothetical protein